MTLKPARLAVLQALTAHLERLNPATDPAYRFDLRDKVFRGRHVLGDDATEFEMLPVVSILESPRPDMSVYTAEWGSVRHDHWTLLVQGIMSNSVKHATDDTYWVAAEVETHLARLVAVRQETGSPLYPHEHLLGGLISGLEIAAPIIRPSEKGVSAKAFFYLPLRLQLAVDLRKPYACV